MGSEWEALWCFMWGYGVMDGGEASGIGDLKY